MQRPALRKSRSVGTSTIGIVPLGTAMHSRALACWPVPTGTSARFARRSIAPVGSRRVGTIGAHGRDGIAEIIWLGIVWLGIAMVKDTLSWSAMPFETR